MNGILVAGSSGNVEQDIAYDSRKKHLLADLSQPQKHLDILDNFTPGTALALTGVINDYKEEVLFTIPHHLGFQPYVLGYFFIKSISGDVSQGGGYSANTYFFSGSAGTFEDSIKVRANTTNFQIVHVLQDFGFSTTWNSPAPTYSMRIKYFIYSNPVDRIL